MTTPQTYIVQPDGWHVKKKNPYQMFRAKSVYALSKYNSDWVDFEANNPQLPLTAWHQPGSEVVGEPVTFYEYKNEKYRANFGWQFDFIEKHKLPTTIRFEVISNVGGEKPVDEAKPELSVEEAAIINSPEWKDGQQFLEDCHVTDDDDRFCRFYDFTAGWRKGHTHAIQSKELVKLSDVGRVIEKLKKSSFDSDYSYHYNEALSDFLFQLRTINKNSNNGKGR